MFVNELIAQLSGGAQELVIHLSNGEKHTYSLSDSTKLIPQLQVAKVKSFDIKDVDGQRTIIIDIDKLDETKIEPGISVGKPFADIKLPCKVEWIFTPEQRRVYSGYITHIFDNGKKYDIDRITIGYFSSLANAREAYYAMERLSQNYPDLSGYAGVDWIEDMKRIITYYNPQKALSRLESELASSPFVEGLEPGAILQTVKRMQAL